MQKMRELAIRWPWEGQGPIPVDCVAYHSASGTLLIFTRETGYHSSGWWKNPDYERCWHLSLSFRDQESGEYLPFNEKTAMEWIDLFFGDDKRMLWIEPPAYPEGKKAGVWHYRLFCAEGEAMKVAIILLLASMAMIGSGSYRLGKHAADRYYYAHMIIQHVGDAADKTIIQPGKVLNWSKHDLNFTVPPSYDESWQIPSGKGMCVDGSAHWIVPLKEDGSADCWANDVPRKLIERAIQMGWKVGSEGGSAGEITYEDVIEGAEYD